MNRRTSGGFFEPDSDRLELLREAAKTHTAAQLADMFSEPIAYIINTCKRRDIPYVMTRSPKGKRKKPLPPSGKRFLPKPIVSKPSQANAMSLVRPKAEYSNHSPWQIAS